MIVESTHFDQAFNHSISVATVKYVNPFYHRVPIQDPAYFFGRAHELQRITGLITNGQSVALIGPRRIGKSSLLAQLRELGRGTDQVTAVGQTVVYFSGEAWQGQPTNVLYAALWVAISDALDLTDPVGETLDFPTLSLSPSASILLFLSILPPFHSNFHPL